MFEQILPIGDSCAYNRLQNFKIIDRRNKRKMLMFQVMIYAMRYKDFHMEIKGGEMEEIKGGVTYITVK